MNNNDKETVRSLLAKGHSQRSIGNELGTCLSSVRYWMKKWGFTTSNGPHGRLLNCSHMCACGETNPTLFYGKKTRICGKCHNKWVLASGQKKRAKARELLGNVCCACGFDKYETALEFHHKDPKKKDPDFKGLRGWSWERIEEEMKGCVLLCANCHRGVHAGELIL